MYNIVIFSGGTGSIALQEGFSAIYGNENYNLDIIINAYDNGKSTGECRRLFDNKLLGPSDLRKNQLTQFKLQKQYELKDFTSRESVIYRLFNLRIEADCKECYYEKACSLINENRDCIGDNDADYLLQLLDFFFFENVGGKIWRNGLDGVNFSDFSIANIFYSVVAVMNRYSLRMAGKDMATFLGIKDNVHLISDVNLFLQAETESGKTIVDEGDIVEWDNAEDRIRSVTLIRDGAEYVPSVDEGSDLAKVKSVKDLVEAADIIIFSSGTQWSSLIPTYMHSGLRKILSQSKAKKYIVMNSTEDHDMKGVSATEIIQTIGKYIPVEEMTAVINLDAVPTLNVVHGIRNISGHLGGDRSRHNPIKLVGLIMQDYFLIGEKKNAYVYDLDGTLWDERANNRGKAVGVENINLFNGIVHSGNNYEHVRDVFKYLYHQEQITHIYSDFGNVHFTSAKYDAEVITNIYDVEEQVIEALNSISEFSGKIRTRGHGSVVTIKPLVNREVLLRQAQAVLEQFGGKYVAKISGHTSLDIVHADYDKKTMLLMILKQQGLSKDEIVFVGNEVNEGAEACIREAEIRVIQVDDVYECNILLKTINIS